MLLTSTTAAFYQCADATNHWTLTQNSGINSQTVSYAAVMADAEKTIVMNGSGLTLTLPNPPPSVSWSISVDNINASGLTISRNGLNIDGAASNITLSQNQGVTIMTDGTNYFSMRGIAGSGSVAFNSITSGTNTSAAMVVGSTASIGDSGIGQNASTQGLVIEGLAAGTVTGTNSGGSFGAGHNIQYAYSLNSAAGIYWPASTVTITTASTLGCTVGTCTYTFTAPTASCGALPCGGWSGYTAFLCDTSLGPCTAPLAASGCSNITTNCAVTSQPAGAALPTANLSFLQPANAQTGNAPPGSTVFLWGMKSDNNNYPWMGMDSTNTGTTPGSPYGALSFWDRISFNCSSPPLGGQPGKNSFVYFYNLHGQCDSLTTQSRTIHVEDATPSGASASWYAVESIQAQMDLNCNACGTTGSPDGENTVISAQMNDQTTVNSIGSGTLGTNVARFHYFKSGAGQQVTPMRSILGIFQMNTNAGVTNGTEGYVLDAQCTNPGGLATNFDCVGMNFIFPTGTRFGNGAGAIQVLNNGVAAGGATPNQQDWVIKSFKHGLVSFFDGPVGFTTINSTDPGALPVNASLNVTGSVNTTAIANGFTPGYSASCTGGASSYSYELVAVDKTGGQVASAATNICNTGTNPLTSGNPATLSPGANGPTTLTGQAFMQADHIDVYRVSGPMATGKIGTLSCANNIPITGCFAFSDTGLSATGTVPSTDTFGGINSAGYNRGTLNTVQVITSDFTLAANTNLQTITGLTWNVPAIAAKYSFHCSLMYSQATGAVADEFGIQTATVGGNSVDAKGRVDTSATAVASGVLNGLNTTVATAIVTFTPSATGTVFGADLDGTLDLPQNNQGNVINIMAQTSNSSDLVTVKRGSYCQLF